MYNRYVPQADGTYRRNRMEDPAQQRTSVPVPEEPVPPPPQPCEQDIPPCQKGQPCTHMRPPRPVPPKQSKPAAPVGIVSFFRQLLPKNFDTEDLLVVILLLLMAGDCQEDQNFALLTLAIYLFM